MPYITKETRIIKECSVKDVKAQTAGDLNYLITTLLLNFLGETPRYKDYNEAIGALECAKLELYRRKCAPYEDRKIEENGDVY